MYYLTEEDYAVAKSNGIPRHMAYNRYYRLGYDKESAITEPKKTTKRITPNMLLWEQWKDIAEKKGISKSHFYNRLNQKKRPWTPEAAATTPLGVRKHKTIKPEIYELAKKNGIKFATLRNRIFNQHWTHYRAATEPVHTIIYDEVFV